MKEQDIHVAGYTLDRANTFTLMKHKHIRHMYE